jgi:hypothetical protein
MTDVFHGESCVIILKKNGFWPFLGDFFSNSSGHPGVDVMITIFCDFRQFFRRKLAFFSKTNVLISFFHNLALFCVKNANSFADFLANIF